MANLDREHPALEYVQNEPQSTRRPTEGDKKLGVSMLMKIAIGVLVISSLIISISCLMQANQIRREAEELQAEVDDYTERIKKLKYFLDKEVDDEYIAEYAREYLNMYFPDEEIYYQDVND